LLSHSKQKRYMSTIACASLGARRWPLSIHSSAFYPTCSNIVQGGQKISSQNLARGHRTRCVPINVLPPLARRSISECYNGYLFHLSLSLLSYPIPIKKYKRTRYGSSVETKPPFLSPNLLHRLKINHGDPTSIFSAQTYEIAPSYVSLNPTKCSNFSNSVFGFLAVFWVPCGHVVLHRFTKLETNHWRCLPWLAKQQRWYVGPPQRP
jgi:hypothetical protein